MRILISAYACEPEKGSEPGVGWNWVRQIARFHELWVITRANNRKPIEKSLAKEPLPNVHWVYFDLSRWACFWKKAERGVHLYYYLWQVGAYFVSRKLHRHVGFDLGHHVTFVNDWLPTFLCLLPFPFVWGPVGGSTHRAPLRFWKEFGWRGVLYEIIRTVAIFSGRYLDPLVWLTRRKARAIITMSKGAVAGLPRSVQKKAFPLGNVGFSPVEVPHTLGECSTGTGPSSASRNSVVFTTGRLVHWKGYSLLLKASAMCLREGGKLVIWIGGRGPAERPLRSLVRSLGLGEHVKFLGRLRDRESVLSHLMACDMFIMPTLHDGPPVVFLEAMAVGKPVICLDLGGASEVVTSETGIKVSAICPEQVVSDLAAAMMHLAEDPDLRIRLGVVARQRVREHFDWDKKGLFIAKLYQSLSTVEEGATVKRKFSASRRSADGSSPIRN